MTKQNLLQKLSSLAEKTAATVLWKYTDDEGSVFYLTERVMGTLRSPYSGKSFVPKPEKVSLADVGQELKDEGAKSFLWKYLDDEGNEFFLSERVLTPLRSPRSGKSFVPKPERSTLTEVGKELRQGEPKTAAGPQRKLASEILAQKGDHPAFKVIATAYENLVAELDAASASGVSDDPILVLARVQPATEHLAQVARVVSAQLRERLS
jgi:hypothetical protein